MRIFKGLIIFALVLFMACVKFLSILQPESADPNSTFEVPISILLEEDTYNLNERAYFAIRIPSGWDVEDSISYTGIHQGSFIYSPVAVDSINSNFSPKEGYYWWAAHSDTIDTLLNGTVFFNLIVHTDNQVGRFYLDYAVKRISIISSFRYPIDIGLPLNLVVTNTNDAGEGSLRKALKDVSAGGEISFDLELPATIVLDSQLVIDKSIRINGPSDAHLTLSGNDSNRVLFAAPDSFVSWYDGSASGGFGRVCHPCGNLNIEINNITITNGNAPEYNDIYPPLISSSSSGGGIYSAFSNLILKNTLFIENYAENGSAISSNSGYTPSALTIYNSTFAKNNGNTYAISGRVNIINTILWNNTPDEAWGNIFYSNIKGGLQGYQGEGNIEGEPIFADTVNGDYSLLIGSPGIDAGIQDFNIIYNEGNDTLYIPVMEYLGTAPDMGAYEFDPKTSIQNNQAAPDQYALEQNYPNPFNPQTTIRYQLAKKERVTLIIFDINGKEVAKLVNSDQAAGEHSLVFDAAHLASGSYFYQMQTSNGFTQTKKLILLK